MTDPTSSVQHAPISTIDAVTHGVVLRDGTPPGPEEHSARWLGRRRGGAVEFGKVLLNFAAHGRALGNCERDVFDGTDVET